MAPANRPVRNLQQRQIQMIQRATTAARRRARRNLAAPVPNPATPRQTAKIFDNVPACLSDWTTYATQAGLAQMTLRGFNNFKSASKITQQQFLLLRTVRSVRTPRGFIPASFNMAAQVTRARVLLQGSNDFQQYLMDIGAGTFGGSGDFGPLRKQQKELSDDDKDESPVNATFINLLQAISWANPAPRSRWRHTKMALKATFYGGRGYEARTDGQLQNCTTNAIEAIVECKAKPRDGAKVRSVAMQEAAQMVAWIKTHDTPSSPRVLVSQDNTDVFVTFAEYDGAWLDYIRSGKKNPVSLMVMNEFGPFSLEDVADVRALAEILLAITL